MSKNYNQWMQFHAAMMATGATPKGYFEDKGVKRSYPKKSWLSKVIELPKERKIEIVRTPDEDLPEDMIAVKNKLKEYGYS